MRIEGWESRLAALVEARRAVPFSDGECDCGGFALAAIEAVTGQRPARRDHGTLYLSALRLLGPPLRRKAMARRGDLALGPWAAGGAVAFGVVLGDSVATPGPAGLVFSPMSSARVVWPVGRG